MPATIDKIKTVKSGREYYATWNGTRLNFVLHPDGDMVFLYSPTSALGGYKVERFGGQLSPDGIRKFLEECGQ